MGVAYDPPWRVLKLPHKRGDSWDVPALPRRHRAGERMAVAGAEAVTVPAGRFEAMVVEWQNGDPTGPLRYAYAPDVGLVRIARPGGGALLAMKAVHRPR